ncbi:MAG: hypothetical protein WDN26_00050 [Chitinophagaceae bacterium]
MVPSASIPLPVNVVVDVGSVIVLAAPAFATGAWLAATTVTVTSLVAVAPLLSVTVKRKTLAPAVVNPVIFVVAEVELAIVAVVPLTCVHL